MYSAPCLSCKYHRPPPRLRLRLHFRLRGHPATSESQREPKLRLITLGSVFKHPFVNMLWPRVGPHFRPFVVICRIFFLFPSITPLVEGSWPALWRPGPQLSLILGHSKSQKVSSCLHETYIFDLVAFSAAGSSWLLLGSSWGSSWSVFGPQTGPFWYQKRLSASQTPKPTP